ncbi:MAG: phospho-N-acetylmuramoyl-pentapeptide-transferase [Gemmatimonadota bacterium]|nr:phospho-N-acetylmuramoyl-pentapeptide-transferase [Gemmatimonadota bacterium]
MLNYLLVPLTPHLGFLRLFGYISFRAAGAAVTALLLTFIVGPIIINALRRNRIHQVVRGGTPDSHAGKSQTPTMGGLIILTASIVPTLLWARLTNRYIWICVVVMIWMGAIGFLDDYLKLRQKARGEANNGLIESYKLTGQVVLGLALGLYVWHFPLSDLPGASTTLPFYKYLLIVPLTPALAWLYVLFVTFVMTGTSNAVNMTDGLDGLAAGLVAIAAITLAGFAYVIGRVDLSRSLGLFYMLGSGELTVFCASLMGACIGFLWFNTHPAEIFMGDTGSLSLGGAIGAIAVLLKSEFLLLFIGGLFVAEMVSVILQRYVFKYRKLRHGVDYARQHRVFLRAPLHHHFEMKGWTESQVVVRFWIIGILCAFLAFSTLKLR